jgi:hypothetical protein
MRFRSNGGFDFIIFAMRGSFMTALLTRSRCARGLNEILENTTGG